MTPQAKAELATVRLTKPCCRRAEVAAMIRFSGGAQIVSGQILVEAEFDNETAARRLRIAINEIFSLESELIVINSSRAKRGTRYLVRLVKDGQSLARQTGLIDSYGRPIRGLPPTVVNGAMCDQIAAWRGAFLVRGALTEPGRSMVLEVTCPSSESALALVGAARRLDIPAKSREVRGADRVQIRDGDAIAAMLTRMGAHQSLLAWEERRTRREVKVSTNRLANFDDANLRRSARAAVQASARVERALEILGDDVPDHLKAAGLLRLEHRQASLEELGKLHEPPLTKDAIAGRIRRLLAMADKVADEKGIPNTESALTPEILEGEPFVTKRKG